jgi:hypothetical protein
MTCTVFIDGQGKQIDHKNGKGPAEREIEKQQRKVEQGVGFIENVQEWKVEHDNTHDEENDPGFAQLQAVQYSVTDLFDHNASLR